MCHSVEPARHLTGPSLAHVWGKKAGTAEGFDRYSEPLQRSGIVWNEKSLDKWLANPEAFVPGNYMAFPGIRDTTTRSDLIAYLNAVSEGKAPAAPLRGSGMMGRGMMGNSGPANLKQAAAVSQVVSLKHCRGTYIINTASGATAKVWEYNVRLKTDSSSNGPSPGKPVMTGSGMSGDRVSIIFASPNELSQFIKESCE
jgi:cytochrome c